MTAERKCLDGLSSPLEELCERPIERVRGRDELRKATVLSEWHRKLPWEAFMFIKQETRMKVLATALIAVSLSATTAAAQFTITSPAQSGGAVGVDPIMRITSTLRTAVTLSPTQSVPDASAQEAARRALYAMAADECAPLSEVFKSECRLSSVQMIVPPTVGVPATPTNIMSATAVYELRPMRAPGR